MSGDVHVRFCERPGVRFPRATHLVIMCKTQEEAQRALEAVQQWTVRAGLELQPDKTRIVDVHADGFDFLGYHFWRHTRWPRKKSLNRMKDTIRAKTRRTNGQSLPLIIADVNQTVQGWFEYFKHSNRCTFRPIDQWVRMRLRSLLRKRAGRKGRGHARDHYRWTNAFFEKQGLFSLTTAHALIHQPARR